MPPHSKEFVSDGWRDWCSESCCYTTPAAAVNADYLDIIAEIIPFVFVSHTFLVFSCLTFFFATSRHKNMQMRTNV